MIQQNDSYIINLYHGMRNRHKLVILPQLGNGPKDEIISNHEDRCKQRYNLTFRYIVVYILFTFLFTKAYSKNVIVQGLNPTISPTENSKNIAKNIKEESILAPFKDVDNGKTSESTHPYIDPYVSMLLKSLAKTTNEFSKESSEVEHNAKLIESVLPFGTDFKYDSKEKTFGISEEKPVSMGGIVQSILDRETELRYKFRDNIHIDYKIQTYVTEETAKIINDLQTKNLKSLRENYHLVFSRLIEPLRTILAVKRFTKDQLAIMESFNRNWYEKAKFDIKLKLVTKIDQLVEEVPTYRSNSSLFTKVSATRAFLKSKHTEELINIEIELRTQKIIREYMQGVKVLRHYSTLTPMYLAPYYTDLVPSLGSPWLNHLFDKYYMATAYAPEQELSENLPLLMSRFLSMIEQNTITVTNTDFQKSIYAFSLAVGKVMKYKKVPKYQVGKTEYYGFMDMCDDKCEGKIYSELNGNKNKIGKAVQYLRKKFKMRKLPISKNLKLIRWVMLYQKHELMMIETFAEKVLIQLIFKTNGVKLAQIAKSQMDIQPNVKLNIGVKTIKPHNAQNPTAPSMLQKYNFFNKKLSGMVKNGEKKLKRIAKGGNKLGKGIKKHFVSIKNATLKTPLVKWVLSGINKIDQIRNPNEVYVCFAFTNVLSPTLGLDSNVLSTHTFVKDMVEVKHGNDMLSEWYNQTMMTWIQLHSAHSSLHGFDPKEDKNAAMSKSLGAVFRWLNSSDTSDNTFTNKTKTVLASLSLQLAFFMEDSVKGYKKNIVGIFFNKFKNIFTMGKTSTVPKNWEGLNDAVKPKAVVSRVKFANGSRAITALVKMFKDRFIVKPEMPARLVQLIVTFVGMWTKNQQKELDLSSPEIEPARKYFYASLLSNKGVPKQAMNMILKHCKVKSRRKALHLGCINKVGGRNVKCKPVKIRLNKFSLLKYIEELQGTLDDPLEMLKIASDLSKRCIHHNTQKAAHLPHKNTLVSKVKNKLYGKEEYTSFTLLASEFSHRLHCYKLQKKVAKTLVGKLRNVYTLQEIKNIFESVLNKYQSMEIKMKSQSNTCVHKLMCQFMNANNPEIVKIFKSRLLKYATSHGVIGKSNLSDNDIEMIILSNMKPQSEYAKEIDNYQSYILVGTRTFNSVTYSGGYPPNRLFEIQAPMQVNGPGRLVFNGNSFVDELEELKITDPISNITIEIIPGEQVYRRFYHFATGEKVDEYDYALKAANFIVTGSVLTTSRALAENGYENGMIIWCGYKHGWVADFALRDIIHDINAVPLFNGRNWVLSTEARVKDFIGDSNSNKFGIDEDSLNKKLGNINVVYKFDNGTSVDTKAQSTIPSLEDVFYKFDPANTVQGNQPPVFSSTSADLLPGALGNLVKGSQFQRDNNTLVIDLSAPDNVVSADAGNINLIRFNTPPNVNFESGGLKKGD